MSRQPHAFPHRPRQPGPLRLAPALAAGFALLAPAALCAEPPAPQMLRIASIDLAEAPGLAPPKKPKQARAAWRTTFGSERSIEPEAKKKAAKNTGAIDADAVLLQGVVDPTSLRRLFPAGSWRLVVSREAFLSSSPAPVTAIAVRVRPGLRLTAREHLMGLAAATTAPARAKKAKATSVALSTADDNAKPEHASATALRIVENGRATWLVSAKLPDTCGTGDTACDAQSRLIKWREAKLKAAESVVAGGQLAAARPGAPCAKQVIEADLQTLSQSRQDGQPFTGGGCLAVLELRR